MNRNITIITILLLSINIASSQNSKIPPERPKLIIGITIDLMRYDYIYKYWDKYGNNGFKRLINEGSFCKNANFNFLFTHSSSGNATIATGANPSVHGIVADSWYVPLTDKIINCTKNDNTVVIGGVYDTEKHSPENITVTTFADELRLSNYKKSKVISISMEGSTAVINAGHIANAAYYFDTENGNWITTSLYAKELPKWVTEFNSKKLALTYLDRKMETLLPDSMYTESLPDNNAFETGFNGQKIFPYDLKTMSSKNPDRRDYKILKYTPYGNSLTKDFAITAMVSEKLGQDEYTDYLCINFSSTEFIAQLFGLNSVETQDAYLRLDKEIDHFLSFIDSYVGKSNTLIYLTSNHGAAYNPLYMTELGIPAGNFNQSQAISLLKSYLNIIYGKGDWVKYYNNLQIYLNRDLILNAKFQLPAFQNDVAQFMLQFSGIANTATATQLQNAGYSSGIFQKMQNSFNQKRSGDVIINLEPGWTEKNVSSAYHNSSYSYDTHVPLIFYGWRINKQMIYADIDLTDIAPTLSMILDIPYPNGCQGKPIEGLFK